MTTRRHFLQAATAVSASWLLPRSLFAGSAVRLFHFIQIDSQTSWPVADPVAWALENQGLPILERAADGLAKLTPSDDQRVIRLVVRRCGLNLLELRPDKVVVHHWGQQQADLRPIFRENRLGRPEIVVSMRDRKKETVSTKTGDDFLFGSKLSNDFPLHLFVSKWGSRFTHASDDWQAAPGTWSGFAWDDTEDNRIPWAALKSAWRRATPMTCQNCDTPAVLVNFGHPWTGMLNRTPQFLHACSTCCRSFADDTVKDVAAWMAANLDPDVRPGHEMIWKKRVRLEQA